MICLSADKSQAMLCLNDKMILKDATKFENEMLSGANLSRTLTVYKHHFF